MSLHPYENRPIMRFFAKVCALGIVGWLLKLLITFISQMLHI
jgi:hypothetical protein